MKTTTPPLRDGTSHTPCRRELFLIISALACLTLSLTPKAFGVTPAPDGGYSNENTAEGTNALFSLTIGSNDTAIGYEALVNNTTGNNNTATGSAALFLNTNGSDNTAIGADTLFNNTTGFDNTATGVTALADNTTGHDNTLFQQCR